LQHYCDILFVALVMSFSYGDKRLAQRWTTQNPLISGMKQVSLRDESSHLKTSDKLFCVDK